MRKTIKRQVEIKVISIVKKNDLTNIVRKLKGKSTQKFKEYSGISKNETFNLWTQKFDRKRIGSEQQLQNTIGYIVKNR